MMPTWTTTTRLLERLEDDQDEAWTEFLERFRAPVLRLGRRCGLDEHQAQDMAQNTLMAFARRYREGRYDRERGGLRAWLFGIAWREAQDVRRRLARDPAGGAAGPGGVTELEAPVAEGDAMAAWERDWERAVLRQCLDRVRAEVEPRTYEAFERVALREESAAIVAESLGISRNAVFIAKHRVLKRLESLQADIENLTIDSVDR